MDYHQIVIYTSKGRSFSCSSLHTCIHLTELLLFSVLPFNALLSHGQVNCSTHLSASGNIFHSHFFLSSTLSCFVVLVSSRLCNPAVSYPPSYKKTPPPVPPRTTTKPLISVTAQSSTESTQDAYQEGRHSRGALWTTDSLGRPIYSSTDSLDSTKAVTMAMESAAGKRHASLGSHSSVQTCDKAVLVSKAEEYLKTPRSSIGIQVKLSYMQIRLYIKVKPTKWSKSLKV